MGRISNRSLYPNDNQVSLDDFFIGTDRDNQDATRTYPLSGLFATFQSALDLASIQFTFSDGTDPELDENDAGYFTTNSNQTAAPAVTAININTLDANALDVTSILSVVDDQPTAFTLRVTKPNVTNQIFFFAISGITDNLDGTYTLTVSNFIGTNSLQDGTTYSFVFDLSGVPSIYTETDPIFTASPAGSILAGDITNWNTAFGWGNHATAGYQDALGGTGIVKSTAGTISYITDNSANWNTAFSWGNHATAGYLTSFTETDPVFSASAAAGVTSVLIGQWNAAYSWGDHALAGYITSESDPVFTASVAAGITLADTQNWDSAYSWGDHDGLYLPLSGGTMTGNINMGNFELQNSTKITINNSIWAGNDTIEMDFDSIDLFGIGKFGTTKIVYSVSSDKWTVAGRDLSLNLYEVNGSLTGTRTVTMGANQLNWSSGSGDIVMNSGRLGVKQQVFGGSRLGDSEFQAANIDTQAINFKDTGQTTALAMFFSAVGGSDGYVTTMKNFVDSVNVISVAGLGQETFGGVGREVEATLGLRNDFTGGEFRVFDTFNNDYDAATAVAEAQGWVAIHGGGATAKKIGLWRYDTTTYTEILGVSPSNVITFGFDVNVPTEVYGAGWSGSTEVPTKGDLYTKIETLGSASSLNDLSDVTITGAAKGDILVYNGTAWVDLTVGTNGQILSANSAQATGLEWIAAPASGVTSFNSRTGAVVPAAGDYDAFYYTETESDSRFVNVTGDTMTGQLNIDLPSANNWALRGDTNGTNFSGLWFYTGDDAAILLRDSLGNLDVILRANGTSSIADSLTVQGGTVWHSNNDDTTILTNPSETPSATTDLDTLTNMQTYLLSNHTGANFPSGAYDYGTLMNLRSGTNDSNMQMYITDSTAANSGIWYRHKFGTNAWRAWARIWTDQNDGAGSGLNADFLDGKDLSASGNRWDVIPFVAADGVMEVGAMLDFHLSDGDTTDNSGRIRHLSDYFDMQNVETNGLRVNGNIVYHEGNVSNLGQQVAQTGNTTGTDINKWARIARITLTSQFQDANATLVTNVSGTSQASQFAAVVNIRAKQQAAFGNDPLVSTDSYFYNGDVVGIGYVIVQNTPTTIVDFYAQVKTNFARAKFNLSSGSDIQRITWYSDEAWQASPTGLVDGGSDEIYTDKSTSITTQIYNVDSGGYYNNTSNSKKDKVRVWTSGSYSIGMQNNITFGGLNNDYAMTFNMNQDNDRGFWWGDDGHTTAQGAMALTTNGLLTVAAGIRVGFGETDTTIMGATYDLQASGDIQANDFVLSSDIRKKENVKELYDNGRFRFVEYNYIDTDRKRYGVIANEIEVDYPELVIIDDEGFRSASYTDLLVYEHVQQEKEIAELKQEVADLKKDIEIIKMMLKDGKL